MAGFDFQAHGGRAELLEVLPNSLMTRAGSWFGTRRMVILARAQAGHNGLAAFALVAAGQAVDLERGPGGALLDAA